MASLLNASSVMMCPHGGTVNVISTDSRLRAVDGQVLRSSDTYLVTGCPFALGLPPHPCVAITWVQPDSHSQGTGDFTVSEQSVGLCQSADQAAQGSALIIFSQPQVTGS